MLLSPVEPFTSENGKSRMGRWESAITQYLESQIHLLRRGICDTQYTVPGIRDLLLSRNISDHWVHRTQDPSLPQGVSEHSVLSIQITWYLLDPDATEASNREIEVCRLQLQLETAYRWWLPGLLEKIPMQSQVPQTLANRQHSSSEMSALEQWWAHFWWCMGKCHKL